MAREALILALFLIALSPPAVHATSGYEHLLLYEISPYSYSGEKVDYVCIFNPTGAPVNLSHYFVTDFEGYLKLQGIIRPLEKIYVAENATAFFSFFGFYPDFTYDEIRWNGTFALSNEGDEVALIRDGNIVDLVVYGNSAYSGPGWVGAPVEVGEGYVLRRISYEDTDTSHDWSNYHRIGQSDFPVFEAEARVEVFALPDSRGEIFRFLKGAKSSLDIEMYTFTSTEAMHAIIDSLNNGTRVRILLEGSPVGGIKEEERYIVQKLYEQGAQIYFMVNGNGRHNRYSFVHSKFIIRDSTDVMILTENLDGSSIAPCGNRGFGVIVHSTALAEYLERVFEDDTKEVQDIWEYNGEFQGVAEPEGDGVEFRHSYFSPLNLSARVRVLLAPDYSVSLLREFVESSSSIEVEALYLRDYPLSLIYPRTSRILVQFPENGYDMKEFKGEKENLRLLHAKLLIGNRSVLVGSMNFGNNSLMKNREVSVIIESSDAVRFFREVFDYDWNASYHPLAILRIRESRGDLIVDMRDSLAEDPVYAVYVDGHIVYRGREPVHRIHLSPGTHIIKVEVFDKYGNADSEERIITVPASPRISVDPLLFLYLSVFAVFLYKVWKNHRRIVY